MRLWGPRFAVSLGLLAGGCDEEETPFTVLEDEVCFQRVDGQRVCIETYEASRQDADEVSEGASGAPPRSQPGRRPWTNVAWEAARSACASKGKRLCERDEWMDACDGIVDGGASSARPFPYGATEDLDACNVRSGAPAPGGAFPRCTAPLDSADGRGTFDQGGNVWEWTGNERNQAVPRGGGFGSTRNHDCAAGDRGIPVFDPDQTSPQLGFRCCRDG